MNDNKTALVRALRTIETLEARLAARPALDDPIAITGIGCRFPGAASDPHSFWKLLTGGVDATSDLPANRWNRADWFDANPEADGKLYADRAGYLSEDPALFDGLFFGIAPREAAAMDPQQRLVLTTAWEALEDACLPATRLRHSATGIYIGLMTNDYARLQARQETVRGDALYLGSGTELSFPAGRLSYLLGCHGPSMVVATACSSSLVATHLAVNALRLRECNTALAGGVNLILSPDPTVMLSKMKALSPDGRSKPFSAAADGYGRGEGCGIVVLKRLADAQRDGDRIYAVIRATATNHDGPSGGLTIPSGPAQERLIRAALGQANINPSEVAYVEAHGTGTALGDPIEARALGAVFDRKLLLGSVKSNLGHLEAAAGVAALIKTALALYHQTIPASLHAGELNPRIPWHELPLEVARHNTPWPADRRYAGVSSFGLSGINAHAVLERAPAPSAPDKPARRGHHVLTLSARSETARAALASRYAAAPTPWPALCRAANRGRSALEFRAAIAAPNATDAQRLLRALAEGKTPPGAYLGRAAAPPDTGLAFLFTGQGSQYACMGLGLYETEPFFRETLDRCARILDPLIGMPLTELLFPLPGSLTPLDQTRYTQPALVALEYSLARLWMHWGLTPTCLLGHSVGEIAAAAIAGIFTLDDALRFTAERARLMGSLPLDTGGMAAILASPARVEPLLGPGAVIAAINGPENTVIAGDLANLVQVLARCETSGLVHRRLNVSHAFHAPAMDAILPALEAAANALTFHTPRIPMAAALTGLLPDASIATPQYWVRQARHAVRFADGLARIAESGCRHFLEIGPKPVLIHQGRAIAPGAGNRWLASLAEGKPDWEPVSHALAALYAEGFPIDWDKVMPGPLDAHDALPRYPFEPKRYWIAAATAPDRPAAGHPLLGARLRSPLDAIQYESRISLSRLPWLADHKVAGRILFPAAAFWEMALAAAADRNIPHPAIEDAAIERPCVIDPDAHLQLQTVLSPAADGRYEFTIHSFDQSTTTWTRHVRGSLVASQPLELAAPQPSANATPVDIANFYQECEQRGVCYGPSFQCLNEIRRTAGEVRAVAIMPAGLAADSYRLHPVLIDAALQSVGALLHDTASRYLPVSAQRIRIQPARQPIHITARLVEGRPGGRTIDYLLFDDAGNLTGEIKGLWAREVNEPAAAAPALDWLYETAWESAPFSGPATSLPDADALAAAIEPEWQSWRDAAPLAEYRNLCAQLDRRAAQGIAAAFQTMGDNAVIAPRHRRLCARLRQILDATPTRTAETEPPSNSTAGALLDRTLAALPAILSGAIDPLAILFPQSGGPSAADLYSTDLSALAMNAMARLALRDIASRVPAGRTLRVLEVGGGTGGTTPHLLSVLPAAQTEYTFSDISPLFVARAKQTWRDFPFVDARRFDLEADPVEQGFAPKSFDVIIAANVVHVAAHLRPALERLHTLLAPGGSLLLIEGTAPAPWLDLIFGLTEGWWNFADSADRPDYPLASAAKWRALLAQAGFASCTAAAELEKSALIVASKANAAPGGRTGTWLILSDSTGVGEQVAAGLIAQGAEALLVFEGDGYRSIGASRHQLQGLSSSEFQLYATETLRGPLTGVVYLWPLDRQNPAPDWNLCAPLLNVMRTLIRFRQAPRWWIATERAVAATASCDVAGWDQQQLWGMAQVAGIEYPETSPVAIDLEPGDPNRRAAIILSELAATGTETQVAYRGNTRLAARLRRLPPAAPPLAVPTGPFTLQTKAKGSLDRLELAPIARRTPGAREIEIEVRAAGLNFLDVLDALGALPFERGWLGGECSGIVTAAGPDSGFAPGDEVVALASGAFSTHVIADARLAAHKPKALTFAQAAAFPVAFLTAHLALETAALKPGESILIHAISGGTGMAACQLARRLGARVYGTASPAKWPALRALGISELMHSRTLDFARELAARTAGRGVDAVLNSLTGDFIPAGLRSIAPGGRFLEIGKAEILTSSQAAALNPQASYHVIDFFRFAVDRPSETGELLRTYSKAFDEGSLHAVPVTEFPAPQAHDAFRTMQQAAHTGKIAVTFEPRTAIRPDVTYLIAGGTSDLGLLTAAHLTAQGARHLVLAARRAPSADADTRIEALRQQGAQVTLSETDISRRAEVAALLDHIAATMPPLAGIIHSAGVLDDGVLADLEWPRFRRVLEPKAHGAWHLHELTAHLPLDFFTVYSSVAGALGSGGQSNHAAANRFLDALIEHRRRTGRPGLSIQWGAWSELGSAAKPGSNTIERARRMGQGTIPTAQGSALLPHLFAERRSPILVAPLDWQRLEQQGLLAQPLLKHFRAAARSKAPAFTPATGESLRGRLAELLTSHMRAVMGYPSDWTPEPDQGFFQSGMDSLTSLEVRNRLQDSLGITLPATLLFDQPTPRHLVESLAAQLEPKAAPALEEREQRLQTLDAAQLAALLEQQLALMEQPTP